MRWCADDHVYQVVVKRGIAFQSAVRMRWCADPGHLGGTLSAGGFNPPCGCVGALTESNPMTRLVIIEFQSAVRMRWCADWPAARAFRPTPSSFNPPCGCVGALTPVAAGVGHDTGGSVSIRRADALVR